MRDLTLLRAIPRNLAANVLMRVAPKFNKPTHAIPKATAQNIGGKRRTHLAAFTTLRDLAGSVALCAIAALGDKRVLAQPTKTTQPAAESKANLSSLDVPPERCSEQLEVVWRASGDHQGRHAVTVCSHALHA